MVYALLCEGTAEEQIMNILLDNNKLKFSREQLLEEKVIRTRDGRKFSNQYLNFQFDEKITVYRIHDSSTEKFKVPKVYRNKIGQVNEIVTKPEIEMLIILNEGLFDDFCNSKIQKPSTYVQRMSKFEKTNIKSRKFQKEYWGHDDGKSLVNAIFQYHKKHSKKHLKDFSDLYSIIKK